MTQKTINKKEMMGINSKRIRIQGLRKNPFTEFPNPSFVLKEVLAELTAPPIGELLVGPKRDMQADTKRSMIGEGGPEDEGIIHPSPRVGG